MKKSGHRVWYNGDPHRMETSQQLINSAWFELVH